MEPRRRSAKNLEVPTAARRSARIKKLMVAPLLEVPMAAPHLEVGIACPAPMAAPHLEVGLAGPAFQDKKGRTKGRRSRRYPPIPHQEAALQPFQGAVLPHHPPFQGADHQEAPPLPHHFPLLDLSDLELFGEPFRGSPLELLFMEDEGENLDVTEVHWSCFLWKMKERTWMLLKEMLRGRMRKVLHGGSSSTQPIGSPLLPVQPKIGYSLLPVQEEPSPDGKIVDFDQKLIDMIFAKDIIIELVNDEKDGRNGHLDWKFDRESKGENNRSAMGIF